MSSFKKHTISKGSLNKINTKIIGKKIIHFKTIDSTNQYALDLIKEDIAEGTIIISDIQKKGKGRKERIWSSPLGGLWFSIIIFPKISPERSMMITMTTSISIAQAIKKITGIIPEIKWPNDLLIDGKKVCGVLTDLEIEKDFVKYAVVGIGINVNNDLSKDLRDTAISIKEKKGANISLIDLFKEILIKFDYHYQDFKTDNFEKIRKLWFSFSNIIGKKVEIKDEEKIILGEICDVNDHGYLILKTSQGEVRINVGDIKYL
jgi:BirA family biotin operon repressor/biotin-[acetyl-CoA-carboxylase] ligase